jgi:hypothetical protein
MVNVVGHHERDLDALTCGQREIDCFEASPALNAAELLGDRGHSEVKQRAWMRWCQ